MKIIVYGGEGWIGRQFCDIIKNTTNHTLVLGTDDYIPDNDTDLTHVFSFIGEIGVPVSNANLIYIGDISKLTIKQSPNILYLNIGIPINGTLESDNHLTKIIKRGIAHINHNHISVLPELLPLSVTLAEMNESGIINLVNPGTVSCTEILGWYKDIVDNDFIPTRIANQEEDSVDGDIADKLLLFFPYISVAKDSIRRLLVGYEKHAPIVHGFINPVILNNI